MLFNSFQFLLFFPTVTLVYFLLPHRWRWLHLLLASCVFYAAFIPAYLLILLFMIVVDYIAGIMIENASPARRKRFLIISILTNVGILSIFKYYNFFIDNVNSLISVVGIPTHPFPMSSLILPIGLSFHTFQAMSYTIEVYRGNRQAERHFGIYALYVMFYPQLVAGPIERPQNMLHQFHERKYFDYTNLTEGLKQMLWGLFKKVVIADRLGLFVNEVYNHTGDYRGLTFVAATVFFSFQIYCDFSGYSSIAIGAARVMGFDLMKNFDTPYLSRSIREFWQRWHISLSTWFRDYVYIPLGGNKVSTGRWYYNLFITFLISGIWHGANWTFVIWGALHGAYVLAAITNPFRPWIDRIGTRIPLWAGVAGDRIVVFVLVSFAWIFFRSNSLADSVHIVRSIADLSSYDLSQLSFRLVPENKHSVYTIDMLFGWIWIFFLIVTEIVFSKYSFQRLATPIRWSTYIVGIIIILLLGVFENNEFIYFQF